MKIADLSDTDLRDLLTEMEQDPKGFGRMDLEAVLLRVGYTRHPYNDFDLYLRDGHRPFHLRTTQAEVPADLARMIAQEGLSIL